MSDFKYKVGDTVGYAPVLSLYRTKVNATITAIGKSACLVEVNDSEYLATPCELSSPITDEEMALHKEIVKISETLDVNFDKASKFHQLGVRVENKQ